MICAGVIPAASGAGAGAGAACAGVFVDVEAGEGAAAPLEREGRGRFLAFLLAIQMKPKGCYLCKLTWLVTSFGFD